MWAILQILFRVFWLVVLGSLVLGAAVRYASLAYTDGARKRAGQRFVLWYMAGFAALVVIEIVLFLQKRGEGRELVSAGRVLLGLHWCGILTSLYACVPLIFGWREYNETSLRPVKALEEWLARIKGNPQLVFDDRESQGFTRELKRITDRRPPFLGAKLEAMRKEFLALSQAPPKDVCLQRAVEFLRQNRQAEALAWARRWNADSLEFFLLCLEHRAWNECVERIDAIGKWLEDRELAASVLREEVLQILGDLPEQEALRQNCRKRLTENRDMRRRRAMLELKSARPDVSMKLLEHDWEAANWIRAAQAGGSGSPVALASRQ